MTVTQYVGSEERLRFPLSPLAPRQQVVRWDAWRSGAIEGPGHGLTERGAVLSDMVACLEEALARFDSNEPPHLQELVDPEDSSGRITTYLIVPTKLKPAEAVVELSRVDDLVAGLPEGHPLHDVIIDVDFR